MKRILLNTAFAAVLSLANTTYASVDNRDDPLVNQDDVSKNTLYTQTSAFSEEMYKNIFQYLPLESSGRFSQVSQNFKRLINKRNRDLCPQFIYLLKSLRNGRLELKLTKNFPYKYVVGGAECRHPDAVHSLKDDGGINLGKKHRSIYCHDSGAPYLISDDDKVRAGVKDNKDNCPQAFITAVDNVQSPQSIQHPEGIVASYPKGMSPNGQNIFGCILNKDRERWGFVWTPEKKRRS